MPRHGEREQERAIAGRHWQPEPDTTGRPAVAMHPGDAGGEFVRVRRRLLQLQEVLDEEVDLTIRWAASKLPPAENAGYQAGAGCVDGTEGRVFSLEHHLAIVAACALCSIVRPLPDDAWVCGGRPWALHALTKYFFGKLSAIWPCRQPVIEKSDFANGSAHSKVNVAGKTRN